MKFSKVPIYEEQDELIADYNFSKLIAGYDFSLDATVINPELLNEKSQALAGKINEATEALENCSDDKQAQALSEKLRQLEIKQAALEKLYAEDNTQQEYINDYNYHILSSSTLTFESSLDEIDGMFYGTANPLKMPSSLRADIGANNCHIIITLYNCLTDTETCLFVSFNSLRRLESRLIQFSANYDDCDGRYFSHSQNIEWDNDKNCWLPAAVNTNGSINDSKNSSITDPFTNITVTPNSFELNCRFNDQANDGKCQISFHYLDLEETATTTAQLEIIIKNKPRIFITLDMLLAANLNEKKQQCRNILPWLNKYAKEYGIKDKKEVTHFLSQVAHESKFEVKEEDLYYKPKKMRKTFGCNEKGNKYDKEKDDCTLGKVKPKLWTHESYYAHNPENLANYVYAGKNGNGDEVSGDGYKYRGRGLIQLTGKNNYDKFTRAHNKRYPEDIRDFVENPDLIIENISYGVESAFHFWTTTKKGGRYLSELARIGNVQEITRIVNGGSNGYADRKRRFNALAKLTGVDQDV
jgi:predicted chitinase